MTAGNVTAQNTLPEGKPLKATLTKQSGEVSTSPAEPKLQTANEQQAAKPIKPGGEFKSADARMPSNDKDNALPRTPKPPVIQEAQQPLPAMPLKKEETKTVHVEQQ